MAAGNAVIRFNVFPDDNTGGYGTPVNPLVRYRARVDNVAPNVYADADDANSYCNKACHLAATDSRYPTLADANPAAFDNPASPLPFFPDFADGSRDFTNGYLGQGPIRYRFTCSTCHDPHGSPYTSSNGSGGDAWPDLRMKRQNPPDLCTACHK